MVSHDTAPKGDEEDQLTSGEPPPKNASKHDDHHHVRDGIEHVDEAHDGFIHPSAHVSGCRTNGDTDDQRDEREITPTINEMRPPRTLRARMSRPSRRCPSDASRRTIRPVR